MAQNIGSYTKAPGDTLIAAVDFGPDLSIGVTLSSAVCSVNGGLTVGAVTTSSSVALPPVTGGRKGQTYEIEIAGTYSNTEVRTFAVSIVVI